MNTHIWYLFKIIYCADNIKDLLKTIEIKNNCYDSPSNNANNLVNKGKINGKYVQCNIIF